MRDFTDAEFEVVNKPARGRPVASVAGRTARGSFRAAGALAGLTTLLLIGSVVALVGYSLIQNALHPY